jgi:pimeloyl-ACP methyl ester carboxylesterase
VKYSFILLILLIIGCAPAEKPVSATDSTTVSTDSTVKIPYGRNTSIGKYVDVGDAKLYYEIYGTGKPIVLLHGGVYGGIDEFEPFIEKLSPNFQVICIATRGHGKSEIGAKETPFSWNQRADDAYKVIHSIVQDSVIVLGFSDGGATAYKLAAAHPEVVKKMIVIGSGDRSKKRESFNYTPEMLLGQAKEYFEDRLTIMPEPERWGETLTKLTALYANDLLSTETFSKIQCPTLVMAGDRDGYGGVGEFVTAYKSIKKSQLSIIAGCDHVVFFCNFPAVWDAVEPFIQHDDFEY